MMKFWKRNSQLVDKKGSFKESELERIQEEMNSFDKYFSYMKTSIPCFNEDRNEIQKQCFFLNLFNFLVLYQISVLMISNPDAI